MTQPKTASKFTPGPWHITEGPPACITRQTRPGLDNLTSGPGFTVHAPNSNLNWPGSELVVASYTYTEANARLIAQAPEMYELLALINAYHVRILQDPSDLESALDGYPNASDIYREARRIKAEIDAE